jgi:serine/threonine protein kinase
MTQNGIVSYATRAHVPYKRDDEQPHFSGGQATVFRAIRTLPATALRRRVETFAIKEILVRDKRTRHRLRKEIEHLRLCQHRNVLELIEVYIIEQEEWMDRTFLVTQPWAQASLQGLLRDIANSGDGTSRPCPWYKPHHLDPWPSIVRQCILGLEHLHYNEIRHKDLKPDNILVVDESNGDSLKPKVRVIIADLGISKGYVETEKTTFNGTEQYLAPEQKAEASSTYRSDIFSLGCSISWIHALLSSKQWELCQGDELGIFQLEKLFEVGFWSSYKEVPTLLKRLRQDPDGTKQQDVVDFLIALEDIITSTLLEEPDERPDLQTLLARLDTYDASWLRSETFKILDLCITKGNHTKVLEIDFSAVRSDGEAFELINNHYSMTTGYYNFDWLWEPGDVKLTLLSSMNTFEVLKCPCTPFRVNLLVEEYGMHSSIFLVTFNISGKRFLAHLCLPSTHGHSSSGTRILEALPIRQKTIHHHRDGSHTVTTIRDLRWGVQITKRIRLRSWFIAYTFATALFTVVYRHIYYKDASLHEGLSIAAFVLSLTSLLTISMVFSKEFEAF